MIKFKNLILFYILSVIIKSHNLMSSINDLSNTETTISNMIEISKYLNKYPNYYKTTSDKSVKPQQKAIDDCKVGELTFARQDKKTKYRNFCNIDLESIGEIWREDHCLSEIIRTDEPIKCFFDLDIVEKDEEKKLGCYEWDWIRRELVKHINNIDTGVRVRKKDFVVSYSRGHCKKKNAIKISYHVVILNYWFINMKDFKRFMNQLKSNMDSCPTASVILGMIDWGITKSNQVFKLPYQSKAEENNLDRIQRPLNDDWTVYDFLVSCRATARQGSSEDEEVLTYNVGGCIDDKKVMTVKTSSNKIITLDSWDLGKKVQDYQKAIERYDGDIYKDLIEPKIKDCPYGEPEYFINSIPNTEHVSYDIWLMMGWCLKTIYNKEKYSNDERGLEMWAEWTSGYIATSTADLRSRWDTFTTQGYGFPKLKMMSKLFNPNVDCYKQLIEPLFRFEKPPKCDYVECDTDKLGTAIDIKELTSKYRVLYIKAPMATGKSYMLREIYRDDPDATVLVLSCKRSFASSMSHELEQYGFKNYDDVEYKYNIKNHKRIICSVESLRFCRDSYDYLVIDESETIASNLVGEMNMKNSPIDNMLKLNTLVNHSETILVMDAYLCGRSRDMIEDMGLKEDSVFVNNIYKPPKRYAMPFHKEDDFVRDMSKVLSNKEKEIVFVSNSLKKQEQVLEKLYGEELSIIKYNARSPLDKKLNVNDEWRAINMLTYTPTITAGVSYDARPKDVLYLYTLNQGSCLLRDTIQASKRVRKFTNNNIRLISRYIKSNGEFPLTLREVGESENNFIEGLSKDFDWLKRCGTTKELKYIVNIILWCKLEQNLNIKCFHKLQERFFEEENIVMKEKVCNPEKIDSRWEDDLNLQLDDIESIDQHEFNEISAMKEDENVIDDDDFKKWIKYKFLNIDIENNIDEDKKRQVFREIGLKLNRDVWLKNISFKKFVSTILDGGDMKERIKETIMNWGKVGDKAEIQQKYLIRWSYLLDIMNDMGMVKERCIAMKPFMTCDYDKLLDKYKTISFRSLSQIFDNSNVRVSNVKDDRIVNFSTKQAHGIFKNLLKECLGLELVNIGRKKIKGRENKVYDFKPIQKDIREPMSCNYFDMIKYSNREVEPEPEPVKKRFKFKVKKKKPELYGNSSYTFMWLVKNSTVIEIDGLLKTNKITKSQYDDIIKQKV